jgi:MoxR-like ATPase
MNQDLDPAQLQAEIDRFKEAFARVRAEVGKVIVGQDRVVEAVLTAILCGGNVLLEGVPGLGKTELVKALSRVLELDFKRIQFTPDLMPADVIGSTVMNPGEDGSYRFEFRKGPVFTQLLLADEINRATPKTQSALLETMQEGTVTADGTTWTMEQPFFVLATQNPLEQEGTYPLPEAQLDRFLFKVDVPFPNRDELHEVVLRTILRPEIAVERILDGAGILSLRALLNKVVVAPAVSDYAVRLVLATHPSSPLAPEKVKQYVKWGGSPRAAQALLKAARVKALADGRPHAAVADVRAFAGEVLGHRVILNYDGQAEEISVPELVAAIAQELPDQAGS